MLMGKHGGREGEKETERQREGSGWTANFYLLPLFVLFHAIFFFLLLPLFISCFSSPSFPTSSSPTFSKKPSHLLLPLFLIPSLSVTMDMSSSFIHVWSPWILQKKGRKSSFLRGMLSGSRSSFIDPWIACQSFEVL